MKKTFSISILILVLLLLCGCGASSQGGIGSFFSHLFASKESPELAPLEPIGDEEGPSLAPLEPIGDEEGPSLAPLEPLGTPSGSPDDSDSANTSKPSPKNADWVIQLDDTQEYTNKESGFLYHCNLYLYATKAGGTDVLGAYTGQIVLKMEPDLEQLAEMIGEDGLIVDSISGGGVLLEGFGADFEMVAYNAKDYAKTMKEIFPDQPGLQMTYPNTSINAMALELISMKFHYDSVEASGHDESGNVGQGWGNNAESETEEPVVIQVDGATVYVSFPRYGFDRAFKGTVVGNVQ